jgi:hypothetical protein
MNLITQRSVVQIHRTATNFISLKSKEQKGFEVTTFWHRMHTLQREFCESLTSVTTRPPKRKLP